MPSIAGTLRPAARRLATPATMTARHSAQGRTYTTVVKPAPRTYVRKTAPVKPAPASTSTEGAATPSPTAVATPSTTAGQTPNQTPYFSPVLKQVIADLDGSAPAATQPPLPPVPDAPPATYNPDAPPVDWSSSFHGLSTTAFSPDVARQLMAPIDVDDIEIKPDGIIYLPEIKYRRILNLAFGPGGWGLAPRGELAVGDKIVSREYALVVGGRFVGQARGECGYFGDDGVTTAGEGCKSNALMRCCKDLGVASELWDPRFIRKFKASHCREVWVEHVVTKKKRQIWTRNDCAPAYPFVLARK